MYVNLLEYTPKIAKITENTLAFTDHLVIFTIFWSTGVHSKSSKNY